MYTHPPPSSKNTNTLNHGLVCGTVNDLEWPVLDVLLHSLVVKLAANEALGIKDGVAGVDGDLVLGGITNQALCVGKGHIGWRCAVTLVIGDDLHSVVGPDTDTTVMIMAASVV